ncbi:MAG: rhomboid family intramembrane serine protease [Micromonosporaceae bacterium]|nr:rhomboid family intramembrane serine protease [Micromonosporaceae bacterium]
MAIQQGAAERFGTVEFYAALGRAFVGMCAVVPVLFLIELLDLATGHRLDQVGGVRPHDVSGLDGVIFSPFLHGNFPHLYGNSVPLIITGTFVLARGVKRFLWVTAMVALISGVGVWLIGKPHTTVIGASGVIFGYLGYLLVRGIVERSWWGISVGVLVGLLYGWTISGLVYHDPAVAWQAHLFGLLGGVVAAVVLRQRRLRRPAVTEPTLIDVPTLVDGPVAATPAAPVVGFDTEVLKKPE